MKILAATSNAHKIDEIKGILDGQPFEPVSLSDMEMEIEPVEEGEDSYEDNAAKKALYYSSVTGLPSVADDTGLEIDALSGKPGPLSARFIDPSYGYNQRNEAVLALLSGVPDSRRTARFICVVAVAFRGELLAVFRGELEGRISRVSSGAFGFGYDPIFYLPSYGCSLADIGFSEKNKISHRALALAQAIPVLRKLPVS